MSDSLLQKPLPITPPPLVPIPFTTHPGPLYLFALIIITLIGLSGTLAILYFSPHGDNNQIITRFISLCCIALTQIITFIKIGDVKATAEGTHRLVNSEMADLKRTIAELEFAKGRSEGIAYEQEVARVRQAENLLEHERQENVIIREALAIIKASRVLVTTPPLTPVVLPILATALPSEPSPTPEKPLPETPPPPLP